MNRRTVGEGRFEILGHLGIRTRDFEPAAL